MGLRWTGYLLMTATLAVIIISLPREIAFNVFYASLTGLALVVVARGVAPSRYRRAAFATLSHSLNTLSAPLVRRRALRAWVARLLMVGALLSFWESVRIMMSVRRIAVSLEPEFVWFGLGVGLVCLALWLAPGKRKLFDFRQDDAPADDLPQEPPSLLRLRWLAAFGGGACLAYLIQVNWHSPHFPGRGTLSHHLQFALLVGAVALLMWGLGELRWRRPAWLRHRLEIAGVAGLTLAAFALRLYDLEMIPAFIDEANFATPVRYFRSVSHIPLLQPMGSIAAFPFIYPYFQHLSELLVSPSLTALRIPSAVFGALTVPALYVFARVVFNRPLAITAALLLLTFPVHLQFSRIGLNNVVDPLFGVLALAALAVGMRDGSRLAFVVAGVCLGFTQYFYEGGRLLLPIVAALWFLLLALHYNRARLRLIVLTVVTMAVLAIPIYATLASMGRPAAHRLSTIQLGADYYRRFETTQDLIRDSLFRFQASLRLIVVEPEAALYYAGRHGIVVYFLAPLLLLGLAVAAWRWRKPSELILLAWVMGALVGLNLITRYVYSPRLVVIFPALILLVALGLYALVSLLWNGRARERNWMLTGAALGLCVLQAMYYFGLHVDTFNRQVHEREPSQEAVMLTRNLPPNTVVTIIHEPVVQPIHARAMVEYLREDLRVDTLRPQDLTPEYLAELSIYQHQAFYLSLGDQDSLRLIRQRFNVIGPISTPNPYAYGYPFALYFAERVRFDG